MAANTKQLKRDGSPGGGRPIPQGFDPVLDDYQPLTGSALGGGRWGADSIVWGKTAGGVLVPLQVDAAGAVQTSLIGSNVPLDAADDSVSPEGGQLLHLAKAAARCRPIQEVISVQPSSTVTLFQTTSHIILRQLEIATAVTNIALYVYVVYNDTAFNVPQIYKDGTNQPNFLDTVTVGQILTLPATMARLTLWSGVKNADSTLNQVFIRPELLPLELPSGLWIKAFNQNAAAQNIAVYGLWQEVYP